MADRHSSLVADFYFFNCLHTVRLDARRHKFKNTERQAKKRGEGGNRHEKVTLGALLHAPPGQQKKVIYNYWKYQEIRDFPRIPPLLREGG